jgi:uncharacterized protein YndB with AHSA1/START domain
LARPWPGSDEYEADNVDKLSGLNRHDSCFRAATMTTRSRTTVRLSRHFNIPPERVFDVWTDPKGAWKWIARASGDVVRVEIDPRVHGSVRVTLLRNGQELDHLGEYLELARPHRIAFTWASPSDPSESAVVRVTLAAARMGTNLVLAQERVPQGYESRTMQTWGVILDAMAAALERST